MECYGWPNILVFMYLSPEDGKRKCKAEVQKVPRGMYSVIVSQHYG